MGRPDLLVGTSGYAYKEWKGSFYPEKLPQKEMLRFYGTQFRSVEVNNTFYRMPKESVLQGWSADVPEGFEFVLKASRRITHFKRLKGVEDETDYLLRTAAVLGEKLGPMLFQFPPNFKLDLERLDGFLRQLPRSRRAAFEFRHASWTDETVTDRLREHGAAIVAAETDDDAEEIALRVTADWGYLRLRKTAYADRALDRWLERLDATGWSRAYVFFKHEDEGTGPALARRLLERAG